MGFRLYNFTATPVNQNSFINGMKRIRYLKIEFDGQLKSFEIPAFRGAVVKKTGLENELFHNHKGQEGYHYRYPLIQYKTLWKHPSLLCLNQGVDEVHKFFENRDWSIELSGKKLDLKVNRLDLNRFNLQVWNKTFNYSLRNWIGLNQKNHDQYLKIESLEERIRFLEKKLVGNILAFAKGIDWHVDKQINLKITELNDIRPARVKDQKLIGFNLLFKTNVFLPNFIGLGKRVSHGYGVVKQIKDELNGY